MSDRTRINPTDYDNWLLSGSGGPNEPDQPVDPDAAEGLLDPEELEQVQRAQEAELDRLLDEYDDARYY